MGAQAYGSITAFVLPTCHDDEMWIGHGYSRHYLVSRVHINFPDIFHFYFLNLCISFFLFISIVPFSLHLPPPSVPLALSLCLCVYLSRAVQCQLCCSSRRLHVVKSTQKSALLYIFPSHSSYLLILVGREEITPVFLKNFTTQNSFFFALHSVWRFCSPSSECQKYHTSLSVMFIFEI